MFFLILIIFLIQLILTTLIISVLLSLDMRLIMIRDSIDRYNLWLEKRKSSIESIFSDIKLIINNKYKKFKKKKIKLILNNIVGILEWLLFFYLKPKGKKFIAGYKLAKYLFKEL